MTTRRQAISSVLHTCAAAAVAGALPSIADGMQTRPETQRYLLIGLCGSENPTRANFPFAWAADADRRREQRDAGRLAAAQ